MYIHVPHYATQIPRYIVILENSELPMTFQLTINYIPCDDKVCNDADICLLSSKERWKEMVDDIRAWGETLVTGLMEKLLSEYPDIGVSDIRNQRYMYMYCIYDATQHRSKGSHFWWVASEILCSTLYTQIAYTCTFEPASCSPFDYSRFYVPISRHLSAETYALLKGRWKDRMDDIRAWGETYYI